MALKGFVCDKWWGHPVSLLGGGWRLRKSWKIGKEKLRACLPDLLCIREKTAPLITTSDMPKWFKSVIGKSQDSIIYRNQFRKYVKY